MLMELPWPFGIETLRSASDAPHSEREQLRVSPIEKSFTLEIPPIKTN